MTFLGCCEKTQDYGWGCSYVLTDLTEKSVWAKGKRGQERWLQAGGSTSQSQGDTIRNPAWGRKLVLVGSRHVSLMKDLTSRFLEE